MVNGRLRCLGSAQHLKHRFGNGFEVNIKMQAPTEESLLNALKIIRSRTNIGALVSSQLQSTTANPVRVSSNEGNTTNTNILFIAMSNKYILYSYH